MDKQLWNRTEQDTTNTVTRPSLRLSVAIRLGNGNCKDQSLDLFSIILRSFLSFSYVHNSTLAECHIITKLVMMGSHKDYSPIS